MIVKNLEKKEKSTVTFDVVCDAQEFEKAINSAYLKARSRIFVQGFRKGKAPRMVIEGMYGKDVFYEDAADDLAPEAFNFAVKDLSLRNVGNPTVTRVDFGEDKQLTLSFLTAVWPEVTLGEYKGLEAPKAVVNVTDEQVDQELEKTRQRNGRIVSVDRPARDGDTVVIDYEGTMDGVPFEGGRDEGHNLLLGSNSFIPGFEDQVIGMCAGEEKDIEVTFPEGYSEESLAGRPAVFHVRCNEVKEVQLPDLDDEFAKDVSEFDTLDEYRADVRAKMEKSQADSAETAFRNALVEKASGNITADIPDAMFEVEIDRMVRESDNNLRYSGMNIGMYLDYMGLDMDGFRKQCRPAAETRVKIGLLLDKVAEEEAIEVSEEEIEKDYEDMAEQFSMDLQKVKDRVPVETVIQEIKTRRAEEIICSTGIPTEPGTEDQKAGGSEEKTSEEGSEAE